MGWLTGAIIGLCVSIPFAIGVYSKYKEREENNQCIHCGAPYDEDSVYCPGCGKNLATERARYKPISRNNNGQKTTRFCPNCGNPVEYDDSFCSSCGNRV